MGQRQQQTPQRSEIVSPETEKWAGEEIICDVLTFPHRGLSTDFGEKSSALGAHHYIVSGMDRYAIQRSKMRFR
jgi:hypothetical protein